jgi:hypothetical protein
MRIIQHVYTNFIIITQEMCRNCLHAVVFESPWVLGDNEKEHHQDEVYDDRDESKVAVVIDLLLRQSVQCAKQAALQRLLLLTSLDAFTFLSLGNNAAACNSTSESSPYNTTDMCSCCFFHTIKLAETQLQVEALSGKLGSQISCHA